MKSILIAKAIAETPKKNPEGEYRCGAVEPAVTYTAHSSYVQSNATARRRRTATAPVSKKNKIIVQYHFYSIVSFKSAKTN